MISNKRGEGSTIAIIVALCLALIIFLSLGYIWFKVINGQTIPAIDENSANNQCRSFYNDNGINSLRVSLCKKNDGCSGSFDTKSYTYCCDLEPDDKVNEGDSKFIGCCIPEEEEYIAACPSTNAES